MRRILLDASPTGVQHFAHVSDNELITEEFTPTSVEQEVLDHAHTLRGLEQSRHSPMRHAATIPMGTYAIWRKEWQQKHADKWTWKTWLVMRLNSSDNKNLRTGVNRL